MQYRDLVIFVAGLVAGTMNAAGGGGSFLAVPALIWIGIPSITANMSSTIALYTGGISSAWAYRGSLRDIAGTSLPALFVSTLAGGFAGAILLMHTSARIFDATLPWLLVAGSFIFAFGSKIAVAFVHSRPRKTFLLLAQFLLAAMAATLVAQLGS